MPILPKYLMGEYEASNYVTENLVTLILPQPATRPFSPEGLQSKNNTMKDPKENFLSEKFDKIISNIDDGCLIRCLNLSREKGSSA